MLPDADHSEFLSIFEYLVNLCSFPPKEDVTAGVKKKGKKKKKGKVFPVSVGVTYFFLNSFLFSGAGDMASFQPQGYQLGGMWE